MGRIKAATNTPRNASTGGAVQRKPLMGNALQAPDFTLTEAGFVFGKKVWQGKNRTDLEGKGCYDEVAQQSE